MTTVLDTPTIAPQTRTRANLAAVLLAGAAVTQIVLLVVRPWGERNDFLYGSVEPIRDKLWAGIFVDGLTFAVLAVALSLVVCDLVRARGSALATAGAVVASLGGILFSMGALAMATLAWYATSPTLGEDAGRKLMDYAIGTGGHPKGSLATIPDMAGFVVFTIGSLLLFAALIRSASVPRWLPIALVVATVAAFVTPSRAADFVQIAWMVLAATLAVVAIKARQA